MTSDPAAPSGARVPLREIAALFARLGATAFGGPAVHIAMMEEEVVRRRRWLSRAEFLDFLGASQLIPGPNSTELAMHVGLARGGWRGLVVAGACFIGPAALIVGALAFGYVRFGTLPVGRGILHGIQPVIIAIVVHALWHLGRTAIKGSGLAVLGAAVVIAASVGLAEPLALVLAGAIAALRAATARDATADHAAALAVASSGAALGDAGAAHARSAALAPGAMAAVVATAAGVPAAAAGGPASAVTLPALFGAFLKIGAVLFGSGYVLIAFLREDFVERLGWLTDRQLLDAVAVGQITPGPVLTTATFIGYLLAGPAGAGVATLGIFLPAFVLVAASGRWVRRARGSRWAGGFLDGVNVGSLALIALAVVGLARGALVDGVTVALAAVAAILLALRVHSMWIVLGGAAIGLALRGTP